MTAGWRQTMALAHKTILEHKAFSWQMLAGASVVTGQANPTNCAEYFRSSCGGPDSAEQRALVYCKLVMLSRCVVLLISLTLKALPLQISRST